MRQARHPFLDVETRAQKGFSFLCPVAGIRNVPIGRRVSGSPEAAVNERSYFANRRVAPMRLVSSRLSSGDAYSTLATILFALFLAIPQSIGLLIEESNVFNSFLAEYENCIAKSE